MYRSRYNRGVSKYTKRTPVEQPTYPVALVFGAAVVAQRINGAYHRDDVKEYPEDGSEPKVLKVANKLLVRKILSDYQTDPSVITDEDIAQGELVRTHFTGLSFKILQGKTISDFEVSAQAVSEMENITGFFHMALVSCLPASYERAMSHSEANHRIAQANTGYVAAVGEKVALTVEVARSVYSHKYGVNFVTGITERNQSVFFSYREKLAIGTKLNIAGTVKRHAQDNTTQLNRVRVK